MVLHTLSDIVNTTISLLYCCMFRSHIPLRVNNLVLFVNPFALDV